MKTCEKHNEHFEKRCKSCNREYQRKWFAENKKIQLERVTKNRNQQKDYLRSIIAEYLISHPCVDCGESDPIVLDFDHIDETTKKHSIAQIHGCGMSEKKLIDEISKCVIRCSNCHRKRTAKQFNQWRHRHFS